MAQIEKATTDAELAGRAQAGDSDSFGQLYDRHKHRVYGYVRGYLGQTEGTIDLVQEIFVRALESLPGFQPTQPFGAWLNGITRHVMTDYLRRHYRRREDLNPMLDELNQPTYPPPDKTVLDSQTVEQILAGLNAEQSQLIRLRLLEGLSTGEVARQLYGTDDETNRRKVTVGLYRAMQAARQQADRYRERM